LQRSTPVKGATLAMPGASFRREALGVVYDNYNAGGRLHRYFWRGKGKPFFSDIELFVDFFVIL
jgi:hypothetical protein